MRKTVGYMVTWTTYGSWLQGDKRGYVKNGEIRKGNEVLKKSNLSSQQKAAVKLKHKEREIVRQAIIEASERFGQNIRCIGVCSNHLHMVADYVDVPIGVIVGYYKNAGRRELQKNGFEGKLWTAGYDKRFCFDEESLQNRIDYVKGHERCRVYDDVCGKE